MENLYIWYCTIARNEKRVPKHEDIWIRENFILGKEIEGLNYDWLDYDYKEHGVPPSELLKLPNELYFIIQNQKSLIFDFLPYRKNMFIVSEVFKTFLEGQQSNMFFEFSKLIIVHKKDKQFTSKGNYYLLRVANFCDTCFEFIEDEKKRAAGLRGEFMYPNLILKDTINQEIFFLDSFCYREAMVFTENIKDEIKRLFYSPEIYKITDFHFAFNNRTKELSHLPSIV